jgi:hypothetical protein
MSQSKLQKYLNKQRPNITGHRLRVPVLLSDSKGLYLKDHARDHPVERQIDWWCKKGASIKDTITWLNQNIDKKNRFLGDISLYVWLGTCNLTSKDKNGNISLTCWGNHTIDTVIKGYNEIVEIVKKNIQIVKSRS